MTRWQAGAAVCVGLFGAGFGAGAFFPPAPEAATWAPPASLRVEASARVDADVGAGATAAPRARSIEIPPDVESPAAFLRKAIGDLAKRDAASAILTANGAASGEALGRLYREITSVWAESNPSEAVEWALRLGRDNRAFAMEGAIRGIGKTDPALALELLLSIPADERTKSMTRDAVAAVFRAGDRDSSEALFGHADSDVRRQAWLSVADFAESHPDAALALLSDPPDLLSRSTVENLILKLNAEHFPQRALPELLSAGEFPQRGWLIETAMTRLAETDLASALEVHSQLPDELREKPAVPALIDAAKAVPGYTGYRGNDPAILARMAVAEDAFAAMAAEVDAHFDGDPPADVLTALLRAAPTGDTIGRAARRLIDAARHRADPDLQYHLFSAFRMLQIASPAESRALAEGIVREAQGAEPDVSPAQLEAALAVLTGDDPARVGGLAADVESDELRAVAVTMELKARLKTDPVAAAAWAESLSSADFPDRAPEELAEAARYLDPAQSLAWALRIANANKRDAAVRSTLRAWAAVDPDAARAAAGSHGLPDAQIRLIETSP